MCISRLRQRRITLLGSIFVLLVVILPSIAYVGHWDRLQVEPAHAHTTNHDTADNQDHAAHCHEGPSTCTGPQATVGSWWIGDDPSPIVAADPIPAGTTDHDHLKTEAFEDRTVPPPRFA
jgi:hypothetical protein